MNPRILFSEKAPAPIGPYSQAVECGNLIFLSGQIAIDPATNEISGVSVADQARQAMRNIKGLLQSQGLDHTSIVKVTVFLRDMKAFTEFNGVYEEEMQGWKPARSLVEVSGLPKNVLVEIDTVACR